jgi:hypothetical protein
MTGLQALTARITRLEAIEAIVALKARYAALADAKYTPDYQRQPDDIMASVAWQQALCFTEDARWGGGEFGGTLQGRERLHQLFQQSPWRFATHVYASPVIHVAGLQASATWQLWQLALRDDNAEAVFLFGTTQETYRCDADGVWLVDSMSFDQVHLLPASASPNPLAHRLSDLDARKASSTTGTCTP